MDLPARMKGSSPPLLWDGGIGTELLARGLDLSQESPEAWLYRRPGDVRAVHEGFASAGADVLQTNTFGLARLILQNREARSAAVMSQPGKQAPGSIDPSPVDLIPMAVRLATEGAAASGRAPWIIASLGPSGLMDPDPGRIQATYMELAAAFAAQGVTAVHLETFYQAAELRAALRGVRAASPRLTALCSVTVSAGNTGLETPMGTPLAYILRMMDQEGPDVIGVNCSLHARRMLPSVEALVTWARGGVPVLAQPQVDRVGPECKWRTRPETDGQFVHGLQRLLEAGASAVGGCCGCQPSYIAAMRRALDGASDQPHQSMAEAIH